MKLNTDIELNKKKSYVEMLEVKYVVIEGK